MEWSGQQERAIKAARTWALSRTSPQIFRLFGYAGTGKTTLAQTLVQDVRGRVLFAAFTGKAASVLRNKGCENASTIHSLIYDVEEDDAGNPMFVRNHDSAVRSAALVVIDEVSMVDEPLARDLLSFGTKILVLGDPAQLPPISGTGFFTDCQPDVMLTEVHRQARDNPIIRLSMQAREGLPLERMQCGDVRVIRRDEVKSADLLDVDQVLVGLNKTRRLYNERIRQLHGIADPEPVAGDRLVCLRNNSQKGLLNGGLWNVARLRSPKAHALRMVVHSEDGDGRSQEIEVPQAFFEGRGQELPWQARRQFDEFDYGYALTVHKAQGSQWDAVTLFDESPAFREHQNRWLYTGVTRAAKRLTVVQR